MENLLKCIPHSVAELQPGKYLAFAGHHTEIEVVSLRKMKVNFLVVNSRYLGD